MTAGKPHRPPPTASGRRGRTCGPRREDGRPERPEAFGDDAFAWHPGERVTGLPGGGRRRAPTEGEP